MKCLNCNKELKPAPTRKSVSENKKYCDVNCQHEYQSRKKREDFLEGKYVGHLLQYRSVDWPRHLLIEKFGYSCSACAISEWNGKQITLEVNHIDGDALNNCLENLEFVCPNCHSQTDTFRAKNKNSSRTYRNKISSTVC
jgi:hypothetical protein